MPTINDIAKKLGVSKGTVSKALNNGADISETLRKKILETAVEIGYERNRDRKDITKKLCIIVENMDAESPSGFGYDIAMGFKKLAVPAGWEVVIENVTLEMQKEISYDAFMLQHEYKGAFILGLTLKDPWMEDLKTSRTPAVLYDNYIQENPNVSYVGVNSEEAFDLSVSYLMNLGHKKIGYIGGSLESYINRVRHNAYLQAMQTHQLPVTDKMIGYSYFISECTHTYLPVLLRQQVTAILCAHDLLANAVITQCQELGYRVPEDISVIGFDDAAFSAYTLPPLTTVRQDRSALGNCGYYALTSLLNSTPISTLLLRAELIERKSAGFAREGDLPEIIPPSSLSVNN